MKPAAWSLLVVPMVWGSTYAVTSELLPPGRPLLAAALRALPAGLVLVAAAGELPSGGWWWRSTVLGALNFALFFPLLFTAAYRLPGGVAATAGAVQPLLVVLLGSILLGERPSAGRVTAAAGGLAGVALVVLDGGARLDATGVAAALLGALSMALGTTLAQRWGRPSSIPAFAGWQLTAGGLVLAPLALGVEGLPDGVGARGILGYGYLTFAGGIVAYTLWFRGIAAVGARRATAFALLSPVVATAIGAGLGERLTARQYLGAALVLVSVAAAQRAAGPSPTEAQRVGERP